MASIGDVCRSGTDLHKHLNSEFQEQLEKSIIQLQSRSEWLLELQNEVGYDFESSSEALAKQAMMIQRSVGTQSHRFIEQEAKVGSEVTLDFESRIILLVKQVSEDSIVMATKHTDEEGKFSVYMYKLNADA